MIENPAAARIQWESWLVVSVSVIYLSGPAVERALGQGGGVNKYVNEFHHDFRSRPLPPELSEFQVTEEAVVKVEPAGLRVTLPKTWIHPFGGVGVKTAFGIVGDFEITTAYEILQAETPPSGYGVGVGLRVYKAEPSKELANVAYVVRSAAQPLMLWSRLIEAPGEKTKYPEGTTPWPDSIGRLRLKRTGTTLSFLAAPGLVGEDYQEIHAAEFGGNDIRAVALIGFTGRQSCTLDARFLDLRIKSSGPTVAPAVGQQGAPPQNPGSRGWVSALVLLGLGSTFVFVLGLGAWVYLRQRRAAEEKPKPPSAQTKGTKK